MKKFLVTVAALCVMAVSAFAADLDLGAFPTGKWLDPNYDAVWEFGATGINILDTNGTVLWNFREKTVNDFTVGLDGVVPVLSFSCPEAGRSYRIMKRSITNADLVLEITRPGLPLYTVTMKMQ